MFQILKNDIAEQADITQLHRACDKNLSVSKLKNSLQNILTSIKELETLASDDGSSGSHAEVLMQKIDRLLSTAENSILEGFAKKLKKRQQKRKQIKSKLKCVKSIKIKKVVQIPTSVRSTKVSSTNEASTSTSTAVSAFSKRQAISTTKKPHNRLLKQYDAQRFLRTFELLKILNISRSQNTDNARGFSAELSDLCITWSKVLEENSSEYTQEQHVEDQWSEVFFGPSEHCFYGGEQKIGDFLRVRRIWDSYLTHSKHGTSIPCGWILPTETSTSDWEQYRST